MNDMAYESMWYKTQIPDDMIDILVKDLEKGDDTFREAKTKSGTDLEMRDSDVTWINKNHWVAGFLWHYINLANDSNFGYDITAWDGGSLQYTRYREGQYYNWHKDDGLANMYKPTGNAVDDFIEENTSTIRKLSVTLQLSSHEDYKGGEVQFCEDGRKTFFAPKQKGTVIVFDSRLPHRCRKIIQGERKSIVGWVYGPKWR